MATTVSIALLKTTSTNNLIIVLVVDIFLRRSIEYLPGFLVRPDGKLNLL
jgi:hypothetical protein